MVKKTKLRRMLDALECSRCGGKLQHLKMYNTEYLCDKCWEAMVKAKNTNKNRRIL